MSAGRVLGLLSGLALIALAAGLVEWERPVEARPNLLLVSIDTLRADHLGYEGYARDTSPNLDALAARARRYREAFAPAPWTLPSHAALLTGRHPRELGIEDRNAALPDGAPMLASALAAAGYRTAAFVDSMPGGFVGAARGFARGFEEFVHLPAEARSGFQYDAAVTVARARAWLGRAPRDAPFFLFLHTKSVHALPPGSPHADPRAFPYDKPEPWRSRYLTPEQARLSWVDPELGAGVAWLNGWNEAVASGRRRPEDLSAERRAALEALYDAGIRYVDHQLGLLFAELEEQGLAGSTVVVVTADHGEAFGERGLLLHKELYRDLLRVPLLVHLPWEAGGVDVRSRVTLMDVAPTLLAVAGVPAPAELGGRTLPARDPSAPVAASEPLFTYYRSWPNGYYEAFGLREGRFGLVHHRLGRRAPFRSELFDLEADPRETRPLGEEHAAQREALLAKLRAWQESGDAPRAPAVALDPETERHLEALGYVER